MPHSQHGRRSIFLHRKPRENFSQCHDMCHVMRSTLAQLDSSEPSVGLEPFHGVARAPRPGGRVGHDGGWGWSHLVAGRRHTMMMNVYHLLVYGRGGSPHFPHESQNVATVATLLNELPKEDTPSKRKNPPGNPRSSRPRCAAADRELDVTNRKLGGHVLPPNVH